MGQPEVTTRRRISPRPILGWMAAVPALVLAVLYPLGAVNPGRHVVLWQHFGNPWRGAVLVFALALVAAWLLLPVRSEAGQPGRARLRIVLVIGLVLALIGLGLFGNRFPTDTRELARSADGDLAVVLYEPGTDRQRLHVWSGSGSGRRDAGDLGRPCGATTATFTAPDAIRVVTVYGTFDLRVDPSTGRPVTTLGPTCTG